MGKVSRVFYSLKFVSSGFSLQWAHHSLHHVNPRDRSQATRVGGKCLYLTLSHLWQAEQEDHNFEANFGSTARPCLQKNLFVEVVCILLWTILRPVCDGSDVIVCLTPLPFESMPQGPSSEALLTFSHMQVLSLHAAGTLFFFFVLIRLSSSHSD